MVFGVSGCATQKGNFTADCPTSGYPGFANRFFRLAVESSLCWLLWCRVDCSLHHSDWQQFLCAAGGFGTSTACFWAELAQPDALLVFVQVDGRSCSPMRNKQFNSFECLLPAGAGFNQGLIVTANGQFSQQVKCVILEQAGVLAC